MIGEGDMAAITRHEPFLGRDARAGSWAELARGTYRVIAEAVAAGEWDVACQLIPITILEAEELHDIYGSWPAEVYDWLLERGVSHDAAFAERRRVWALLGNPDEPPPWEDQWSHYLLLTARAAELAAAQDSSAAAAVEEAREHWRSAHDTAVDYIYGMIDACVRLLGEQSVPEVWDHLMSPWYDDHARRLSLENQPWSESSRQLMLAIVDGFHGHLAGRDRVGDVELIEEDDRTGFRFAPCGSGGRVMRDDTTAGAPRMDEPFGFSVTQEAHDWSFGEKGVCTYCVHCALLNMIMPIDRLGYPTRVIEPPVWPASRGGGQAGDCTWWVYRDPSLVPDEVYTKVGRSPDRRPPQPEVTD